MLGNPSSIQAEHTLNNSFQFGWQLYRSVRRAIDAAVGSALVLELDAEDATDIAGTPRHVNRTSGLARVDDLQTLSPGKG